MSRKAGAAIMAVSSLLTLGGATRVAAGSPTGDVSVGAALYPWGGLGHVGDAGHYGDLGSSWMAGLRFTSSGRRTTQFLEVLAGRAPLDEFAYQPGLGLEWSIVHRAAIRLAGHVKIAGDTGAVYTGVRASVGVVFRLDDR